MFKRGGCSKTGGTWSRKKSILKVIKDTERNNLINFKTKKRLGDEHLHEDEEDKEDK